MFAFTMLSFAGSALAADYLVYVGTYTGNGSRGIYAYHFDTATGQLKPAGLAAESPSPSWIAVHPNGQYLYAANETDGPHGGSVTAYQIDKQTGKLKQLSQVSSRGSGPCAMSVDATGKNVLVANYGSGTVALLPVKPDGSVMEASAFDAHKGKSVDPARQEGPHAHSADFSPDNRFALVNDLGLDKVFVYRFDADKNSIAPNQPPFGKVPPGSGPRHLAFHPNGKFAYVVNEMKVTVTAFSWDGSNGTLKEIETVPMLPADFKGEKDGAEIQAHPNGKFLYASARAQANSITVFSVDPTKGTLRTIERVSTEGKIPRNFTLDPTGSYLLAANQDSNSIVIFRIDQKTGKLTPTGKKVDVNSPVCVRFVAK
jgi:6-phosphogluconolactonase